jgi:8-oxo-dGTP pyrophosphatase MutT (NUDIX family)
MLAVPMSPYIARLRSFVGNEMLQLPSVATLCRDDQQRVLLVKQADSDRWSTPGGAIEPGESPEGAAIRETLEETGFEIVLDGLRTALGGPEYRTTYSNGDVVSFVALVYDATIVGGTATPDEQETTAVEWFSLEDLDRLPQEAFLTMLRRENVLT